MIELQPNPRRSKVKRGSPRSPSRIRGHSRIPVTQDCAAAAEVAARPSVSARKFRRCGATAAEISARRRAVGRASGAGNKAERGQTAAGAFRLNFANAADEQALSNLLQSCAAWLGRGFSRYRMLAPRVFVRCSFEKNKNSVAFL